MRFGGFFILFGFSLGCVCFKPRINVPARLINNLSMDLNQFWWSQFFAGSNHQCTQNPFGLLLDTVVQYLLLQFLFIFTRVPGSLSCTFLQVTQ